MEDLLDQIDIGLKNNLYYLVLFVSLALPSICGAISSENGKDSQKKYEDWFNKYVSKKYNGNFEGSDCYYFRCSLLHQGSSIHKKSRYKRVLFIEPKDKPFLVMHNNIFNDVLNIDVKIFCVDIVQSVREWLKEYKGTPLYEKNYNKFMRRYPDGLVPFIVGEPLIS